MPEAKAHVEKHAGKYQLGGAAGGLLAIVLVLMETGIFEKLRGGEEPEHLPRLEAVEHELALPAMDGRSRLDRLEISVSNIALLQEERESRETDLIGAVRDLVEEMKEEP